MNNQYLLEHLRSIPDFPKKGINFRDVTTLFKDAKALAIMEEELYELYTDKGITKKLHALGNMRIANPVDFVMEDEQ